MIARVPRKAHRQVEARPWGRWILAAAGGGAALWLTIAAGIAGAMEKSRPDIVLRVFPLHSGARAVAADRSLASGDAVAARMSERIAGTAIRRDPTNAAAWRSLAMAAENRGEARTRRLFDTSDRMSRRDLPTRVWFVQEAMRDGDYASALRHFDIALRTSLSGRENLIPLLVSATSERALVAPLSDRLKSHPEWSGPFFYQFVNEAPLSEGPVLLLESLPNGSTFASADQFATLVRRFSESGDFARALRVYAVARHQSAAALPNLRDGDFTGPNTIPPIDWAIEQGNSLRGEIRPKEGTQDPALHVLAAGSQDGSVARQLLVLRPGSYSLRGQTGPVPAAESPSLSWRVECARTGQVLLPEARIAVPQTGAREYRISFSVPQGCEAQWLTLLASANGALGVEREAWVDSLTIR